MADVQVDELSIKLSSALDTKLISNLKAISDGLSALKTSLNGLNGQKAVSGMQAVGAGIQNLSASLKSVDSKKLGDIANSVSKLSSASDKIGKMFGGSTSQVKETNKAAKELDKTLNSLVNTYVKELGVKGKEGTGAVKSAVSDVIKGAKDGDVFGSMLENFDKALPIIYKYADGLKYVDNQAADTAKSVLTYMKGINSYNKVFLDNQDTGRGLDFGRKRMQMGPAFTSTKPTSGGFMRWHEFIDDYNQNSGDVVSEDTDFYQFYDRIMQMKNAEEQYRQSAMASSEVRDAISEELMNLCTKAQEAAKEFTDLGEATKSIGGSESATATFSNLKTALDSLSEIEAVPDMSWLTQMSKALQNLASPEISTAVANMPTVITGISELTHGLAGVTVPDLTDISELIKVVSGLGGKGVSGAVNNLPQLANYLTSFMGSLEHLPEVPFTAVADIGTLATEISKFGGKNATGAVTNLPQMGAAVKQLLNDVASAPPIDPSVAQTIQGLGNLNAQAIKGLIQLSNESEKSAKKVNALSKVFKGVGNAGKGFVSTIGMGITALKSLRNHTTNLGQAGFAQLTKSIAMVRTALWVLQRVASGFMDSINLASDLVEVNNVIDHVFGNYTTKIEEIADASIEKFGISELTFKKTAGQFQAMASTMGITDDMVSGATQKLKEMGKAVDENGKYAYESTGKMQDMATSITEWVADIASFYDMDYAEAATKAQSIFSGTTRPLRSIGVDLTQANLKAWALANGLNADIENMTQAEKATLRFQYALAATSVATGDFQRTSQTWANQVRILKEHFNALKTIIGTGLISALKPFVASMNSALSGILKFAQNVLNALGKIFGWEVEIAAGGVSMDDSIADLADGLSDVGASGDDAASGTGKAAKALEEYKRQVLSFDELHMLSAPNDNNSGGSGGSGGGGGAGGSGGAGGGGTGSAGDVSVAFKRTKALYESEIDSLNELGTYVATTLSDTLADIPWETIYQKAEGFGTGLADFLNGLFAPETGLFDTLGNTVEGAINTAINAVFGFGNTFDFGNVGIDFGTAINSAIDDIQWDKALTTASNFGTGIATAINNFVDATDFDLVGSTIANYLKVKVTGALSFVKTLNFEGFGSSVAEAINSFLMEGPFTEIGQTIGTFLTGALDFAVTLGKGFDATAAGQSFAESINGFFETFDFPGLANTLNIWVDNLEEFLYEAAASIDWGYVFGGAKSFFETIEIDTVAVIVGGVTFKVLAPSVIASLKSSFVTAVSGAFTLDGIVATLKTISIANPEGLVISLTPLLDNFILDSDSFIGGIIDDVTLDIIEGIKKIPSTIFNFDTTAQFAEDMVSSFKKVFDPTQVGDIGKNIFDGIINGFNAAFSALTEPFADFFAWADSKIRGVFGIESPAKKMYPIGEYVLLGIKEGFVGAFGDLVKPFADLYTFFDENIIEPFANGFATLFGDGEGSVVASAGEFGSGLLGAIQTGLGNVGEWVNTNVVSKFTEAFNGDGESGGFKTNVTLTASAEEDDSFGLVKSAWESIKNKVSTITADGKDGSGGVLGSLSETWDKLKDKMPKITGKAADGNPKTFNRLTGIWDKVVGKTSTLTGKASDKSGGVLGTLKAAWKKIVTKDSTVRGYAKNQNATTLKTLQGSWEKVYDKSATLTANVNAKATSLDTSNVEGKMVTVKIKASGFYDNTGKQFNMTGMATGGIFTGGKWHDIASYAGGVNSAPTGQLFLAREAGPELVGSLGNHTAVMNNDQIVASVSAGVYSAVRSAMSAVNPGGNNQAPVIEVIVKTDSETLYRQVKRGEKTYNGRYSTVATVM